MTNRKDEGHDETTVWSTSLRGKQPPQPNDTRLQMTNRLLPITQTHPAIAPLRVQNTRQPFQRESQRGSKNQTPKRRGVVTGRHSMLEKAASHKYINGARPLEGGTFAKRTPRNEEMTRVPQKTHIPKGGTKTQPATSFSLARGVAHERTRNSLDGKGTR